MTNLEKYDSSVSKALEAYRKETSDLCEKNIETTSFEDWLDLDTDSTEMALEERRKEDEEIAKSLADEEKSLREGMAELKKIYKEAGFDRADALLSDLQRLSPKTDVYGMMASACNCFHSGTWEIICEDFAAVRDVYYYCKKDGCCHSWSNPKEWFESMKGNADYIGIFIEEAEKVKARLEAGEGW